jgi:hypothetical protein
MMKREDGGAGKLQGYEGEDMKVLAPGRGAYYVIHPAWELKS